LKRPDEPVFGPLNGWYKVPLNYSIKVRTGTR
jgi:hypothetical protein